jgi:hypothetical protein
LQKGATGQTLSPDQQPAQTGTGIALIEVQVTATQLPLKVMKGIIPRFPEGIKNAFTDKGDAVEGPSSHLKATAGWAKEGTGESKISDGRQFRHREKGQEINQTKMVLAAIAASTETAATDGRTIAVAKQIVELLL